MSERSLFLSALEIEDAAARDAFLAEACAGNLQLRSEVEALLKSHGAAGAFLETPAAGAVMPTIVEGGAVAQDHPEDDLSFLSPPVTPGSLGQLGHYEVKEVLGRGAFGIVLRAFDEKLHRMVAIKVMNPELAATSPPRKRFLREARSSASVRHENIVAIHAVEEQPIPYLVMEYIPGMTLQQRLDSHGPLDAGEVLRIGQQIATGLAAAHAKGLIHRDIKPANILLESGLEERAKITDFGLARAADDASLTQSGLIAGTPMYMAPEQAKGQPLDHRADLFSLGSVLYVMASGRPPFRAPSTIAVLKRVCEDTPRPIDEVIPGTPPWLCDIIGKLLAKEPDDRFQSAKEVADVLGQHLAFVREPMRAPRPAPIDRPVELETVVTPVVHRPAKTGGWSPTAVLLAVFAGVLIIPFVGLVLVWLAIPAYQSAYSRIPVLPSEKLERGLQFDGKDDYVKVDGLSWAYPQFTLEAFVTSANDGDNGIIAMLRNGGPQSETMFLFDGPASSQGRNSGAGILGQKPFGNALAPLSTGVRQHRALVYDGQVLHYFVNGSWQGKRYNTAKEGLQWNMRELWIGCKSTETEFFRGTIDQVRISRVARYTQNFSPVTSLQTDDKTLALYNFNEGAGDVLRDVSGNNHHATIFGATWVHSRSISDDGTPLVDTELTPAQGPAGSVQSTHTADPDRRAAEWVLSIGGGIRIRENGQERSIGTLTVGELPVGAFELTEVHLYQNRKVSDAGLANFKNCKNLTCLQLARTEVRDAGLANFKNCKNLTLLHLGETKISDAGLANFNNCKNLTLLYLGETKVSDAGLANFKDCMNLTWLRLEHTQVTDAGLVHFQDCKDLTELNLDNTRLTDAGLAHFKDRKNLTILDLGQTQVTDAGLGQFTGCKNLRILNLIYTKVSEVGLANFQGCKNLESLQLIGCPQVSDVGLAPFAGCPKLISVYVKNTKVTEAGVKKLAAALPSCRIEWDGGVIESTIGDGKAAQSGRPTDASPAAHAKRRFTSDEWIDVIPLIDPQLDKWDVPQRTGKNEWRAENGGLVVARDPLASKLLLPLDSDWPAFECELEFTRRVGNSGLNVNLPTQQGECPLFFGVGGVYLGSSAKGLLMANGTPLATGRRTTMRVEVRRQQADHVSVALNSATVGEWTGDLNAIAHTYDEGFPHDRRVSLWIHPGGNEFVFHRIRVRLLDGGTAETLRPFHSIRTQSQNAPATTESDAVSALTPANVEPPER